MSSSSAAGLAVAASGDAAGPMSGGAATAGNDTETTAEMEAGELERGWAIVRGAAATAAPPHAVIAWGARSDIGRVRENNEDKFDFFLPDDADTLRTRGRLWAVADGMGGHSAGQIASEATLKTVIRTYFGGASDGAEAGADGEDVGERLRRALREAHALISRAAQQFPERGGMGTTATIAVVRGDALTVGHVGDSRAYLLRGDTLRQITNDHSWVEEQVRRGGMTRAEAEKSPYRNVITRSIGMDGALEVDVVREALRPGDVLLLCSDGLSGSLNSALLREHLARAKRENPSWAALRLVDAANEAGGHDNITAVVLTVRRVDDGSDPATAPPVAAH